MGTIKTPQPVMLMIAAFSPDVALLDDAKRIVVDEFGPLFAESELFRFDEFTAYYEQEMGAVLYKRLLAFAHLISPGELARIKVATNGMEDRVTQESAARLHSNRPLNLDPGYIDLGKLILASTKDHAHRIYLERGIFAETTLIYTQKHWQKLPWSYPDYQSPGYQTFFDRCREELKRLRSGKA